MPYAAPSTVSAGQIYTPTMYNSFLQGNADSGYVRMLADSTLGVAAASIDFTSIVATFAQLLVVVYGRTDRAAVSDSLGIRFNNDSGANYYAADWEDNGAAAWAKNGAGAASTRIYGGTVIPGATATANSFGTWSMLIPHYAGTANNKTFKFDGGCGDLVQNNFSSCIGGGRWASSSAISRITILPYNGANLVAGTRATIYGLPA